MGREQRLVRPHLRPNSALRVSDRIARACALALSVGKFVRLAALLNRGGCADRFISRERYITYDKPKDLR